MSMTENVRIFNRYYSKLLGVFDKKILGTAFSLTEGRIIGEIARNKNCTANSIARDLSIDRGYMSRILEKLEKEDIILRKISPDDQRKKGLSLTAYGKEMNVLLERKSNESVEELLNGLSDGEKTDLCNSMNRVMELLDGKKVEKEYKIVVAYDQLEQVKILFQEYTTALNVDLEFQNYEEELKHLPGKYALPDGRLYVMYDHEKLAGCIALKRFDETSCEFKRLYVRPEYRGKHYGRLLMERVIQDAKAIGYEKGYLDTLSTLESAVGLYEKLGFEKIAPYYDNPLENVEYFRIMLQGERKL